jgi:hypothetical protein
LRKHCCITGHPAIEQGQWLTLCLFLEGIDDTESKSLLEKYEPQRGNISSSSQRGKNPTTPRAGSSEFGTHIEQNFGVDSEAIRIFSIKVSHIECKITKLTTSFADLRMHLLTICAPCALRFVQTDHRLNENY